MSVYKPQKGRFWHYDFQLKGRRHHGSTGATTRSKAERVEASKRIAAAEGRLDAPEREIPTLGQAATLWWETKAGAKTSDQLQRRVALAATLVGSTLPVNQVTFSDVQRAIRKRRAQSNGRRGLVANATVNRDIVATLRPTIALQQAALNDGSGRTVPFPVIEWGKLVLDEPKPRPRGLTASDLERLVGHLPAHMHDFVRFQAVYACRLSEMFFRPADLDVEGRRVLLRDRKAGDDHIIPLRAADVAALAARKSRAERAKLATVWWREPAPGRLVALSYAAACRAVSRAMLEAGLKGKGERRSTHALRHTGVSDLLRRTGNLRAAQRLAGHASISSTLTYAHVMEDDLRAALDMESRPAPELAVSANAEAALNPLRNNR